jgi:hypothetical protein
VTPQQFAVYRRTVLNYLQAIGFTYDEACRMAPEEPLALLAFRFSFMVDEDREPATDLKELS